MVGQLNVLQEWIPEQMCPGTLFVLERTQESRDTDDPYVAVLACPGCGSLGLITRRQVNGALAVICGSDQCSAHFYIQEGDVIERKPN
jgi:hypothetical protein